MRDQHKPEDAHIAEADIPLRILLVDDRPENLLALEGLLANPRYSLVCASSGAEAVKCASQEEFAAILLDVQMPEMDGYQTAMLIREREASRSIPIIFVTAIYRAPEQVARGYALGAVDYVTKPFNADELKAKVQSLAELSHNTLLLKHEVVRREQAEEEVRRLNAELEQRVRQRTAELEAQIRERLRVEKSLRESEALHRGIGEAVPDFIWSCWADGRADFVNRRWSEYTGLSLEEANVPLDALHHPDDIPNVVKTMRQARLSGEPFEAEFRFRRHDGVYRWFLARAVPVKDDEGRVVKWIGTSTDIHERKTAEEKLLSRQAEIEALNVRLREAMLETHHRVKNGLQLVTAMIDMQLMETSEVVPAEDLRRLGTHVRTLGLVHELLTEEAKRDTEALSVPASRVMGRLIPLLQETAGGRRIVARLEEVALSTRQATSLAVITTELVNNALHHGRGEIEVSLVVSPAEVVLEVRDQGPGFAEGFLERAETTTGLSLVESLSAWDLRGVVQFENRPEGGARVLVRVPRTVDETIP